MVVNDDDLERAGCSTTPRVDRIEARFDVVRAVVRHDNDTNEILIGHFHDTLQGKSPRSATDVLRQGFEQSRI
jgi:hypothetical protein